MMPMHDREVTLTLKLGDVWAINAALHNNMIRAVMDVEAAAEMEGEDAALHSASHLVEQAMLRARISDQVDSQLGDQATWSPPAEDEKEGH